MTDELAASDALWAKLDAIANITTYDGEVPKNPPLGADGRVDPYAVLYAGGGLRFASALNGLQSSLSSTFQVTCAAGDRTRAMWCVRQVRDGLIGPITIGGRTYLVRSTDLDPGPIRRDDNVTPVRFYLPLEFFLLVP